MVSNITSEITAYLPALERSMSAQGHIVLAYLFGSQASGHAGPLSDVDVAVLTDDVLQDDAQFQLRLDIIDGLQFLLHRNDIDVVVLNQAAIALQYRVVRDGILLFCRNEQARIAFTARVVSAYLDFKPIIERHEHAILKRAQTGRLLDGHNPHRGALERYRQLHTRLTRAKTANL